MRGGRKFPPPLDLRAMLQCRQSTKRCRLPNLSLFSSFCRTLYLTRLASSASARVSKNSLSSKDVAHSGGASLKCTTNMNNDDEEEHLQEETIFQANFGFFDPKPGDFHGVKLLLQNYLDDKPWDLSGFVDLILGQTTAGTVVKFDGNDEVEEEGDD